MDRSHPEDDPDPLWRAERLVLVIRWAVLLAWIPILLSGPYAASAAVWGVYAAVTAYGVVTHVAIVRTRKIEQVAGATMIGDAAAVFAMCVVSGGMASEVYPYFYFHVLTTAIRFGRRETFAAWTLDSLFALALFVLTAGPDGAPATLRELLISVFYLSVVAAIAGILSQEAKEQYRRAVVESRRRHQLLWRLLGAEDEERKRIAGEIHDRMGQRFFQLRCLIDAWKQRAPAAVVQESAELAELEREVGELADEARRIVYDLRPPVLDDFGFVETLREYVAASDIGTPAPIRLVVDEADLHIGSASGATLFRILQEALRNVREHARARTVSIELRPESDGTVELTIRDDGVGFDQGKPAPGHLGLVTMRERAEALGGRLDIVTEPGRGTVVRVVVPS